MKKELFSILLSAGAAACLVSCDEVFLYDSDIEYETGIHAGNESFDPSSECFHYFDSVFSSWSNYRVYQIRAHGGTILDWYADADSKAKKYFAEARANADSQIESLNSEVSTMDLGGGYYSRQNIYYFFGRDFHNPVDKRDYPDFEYDGGDRYMTDTIYLRATAAGSSVRDTISYNFFPQPKTDNIQAVFNHFKLCAPDGTYYQGSLIGSIDVFLNEKTENFSIAVEYSCSQQLLESLVGSYGTDWYLLTFMKVACNDPEPFSFPHFFTAKTPVRLIPPLRNM